MRKNLRTRAVKKTRIVTPGGRTVTHFKQAKPAPAVCGTCGAKLGRAKLTPAEVKKLPKVQRRAQRPLPHLCPKCMREKLKEMVR
ncbi:MAG: 50S ribosomal protein L34e [Candidatus Aenigmatarchaeota archaeon]